VIDKKSTLTVQIVGGLGNQLFGYFAGRAYEIKYRRYVNYDLSQLNQGMTQHGSDLRSFKLEADFIKLGPVRLLYSKLVQFVVLALPKFELEVQHFLGQWSATGLDQPIPLLPTRKRFLVRGYFQNSNSVSEVLNRGQSLELKNPSDWYTSLERDALSEQPIMVHVRRGDYMLLQQEFGLLSAEYFQTAINHARVFIGDSERLVWLFSDDLELAKVEFAQVPLGAVKWIDVPPGTDDAESLLLMSKGSANVVSNSTFSWWSATLSRNEVVVAPSKWFRGKDDPISLIPNSWIRLPSIWKD
jgi:hypothetical protein